MHTTRQHAGWGAIALLALVGCGSPSSDGTGEQTARNELTGGSDFLVKEVSRPPHLRPGEPLEASVTVCNQGESPGGAQVSLYLTADTQVSEPEDLLLKMFSVGDLWPGRCARRTVLVNTYLPEGTWRLGARVSTPWGSPDSNPGNDTGVSARFGLGFKPDLVVRSVEGPLNARPSDSIQVKATVCNQGTAPGHADVALVLSADDVPRFPPYSGPPEDAVLKVESLYSLEPGQCRPVSYTGPLPQPTPPPSSASTLYFLGAVVGAPGAPSNEFDADNNTSGYWLGWGYQPDFAITSVKGPASVAPGAPLTAQTTVCNRGPQAGPVELELYLSRAPLTAGGAPQETRVGTTPSTWLAPEQCASLSVQGTATWNGGAPDSSPLWLGARLSPSSASQDLRPDNNVHPGHLLGVGYGPDLVISSVEGPRAVQPGEPFTPQVTVCNQGTQPAYGGLQVLLWLSEGTTLRVPTPPGVPEAPFAGQASLGVSLNPGQCIPVPVQTHAWSAPGSEDGFLLSAEVRSGSGPGELRQDNNTHAGYLLGVGSGPDFVVTAVKGPPTVRPGDPLTAQVTVCNQGTRAGSTEVAVLLSQDETLRFESSASPSADFVVGLFQTEPLSPGQCTTRAVNGGTPPPPPPSTGASFGVWLGAVANPRRDTPELLRDNNTFVGGQVRIGNGADFIITALSAPPSTQPGGYFLAQVTVCNQGNQPASTEVWLSLTSTAQVAGPVQPPLYREPPVGTASVSMLVPGQCSTLPVRVHALTPPMSPPDARAFFLGAVVNPLSQTPELDLGNNTRGGERLSVGAAPDLVITSVTGPASLRPSEDLLARVTVCNQGTVPFSGGARVHLLLSRDERIEMPSYSWDESSDILVSTAPTGPLAVTQCTTLPLFGQVRPLGPSPQRFHLGALVEVDSPGGELRQDNNTHAGYVLGVGDGPDFVITSMTNPGLVRSGQPLSTQLSVCNQGTQSGDTRIAVLLSADESFEVPGNGPSQDQLVTSAFTGMLPPGACTTLTLSGPAWPPPTSGPRDAFIPYHLGAVVNPDRNLPELIETNNTRYAGGIYLMP